jgi:hypothetical protein
MGFTSRLIITIFLYLLVFFVAFPQFWLLPTIETLNGYGSKIACTCYYFQNSTRKTLQHIIDRELSWPPVKYFIQLNILETERCIQSQFRFFPKFGGDRKACFHHPQLGCSIVHRDPSLVFKPPRKAIKSRTDEHEHFFLHQNPQHPYTNSILDDHFNDVWLNSRAFIIVNASTATRPTIIYERYGDSFTKDIPQCGWSMTKSVFSMLVASLMQAKPHMFPHGLDTCVIERRNITIKHLLQMSDGMDWKEVYAPGSDPVEMLFHLDEVAALPPQLFTPGKCFQYSSKASNVLSAWIRKQLGGDDYHTFPYRYLFDQIGIQSAVMETDPSGTFVTSSFSLMQARDWIRLGLLLYHGGSWPYAGSSSRQILSKDYLNQLTKPAKTSRGIYGLHFWLGGNPPAEDVDNPLCDSLYSTRKNPSRDWYAELPKGSYFMTGFEGQYLFVLPKENLIILRLGASREKMPGWKVLDPKNLFIPIIKDLT